MIQGILFDMDGVLFDTERMSMRIADEYAAAHGFSIPANLAQQVCGANYQRYQAAMLAHLGPQFDFPRFYEDTHQIMAEEIDQGGVPLMPAVKETLAWLAQNGYALAVASSSRHATILHHLDSAGLRGYFAAIIGGDMVQNSKPHPEIFQTAAAALGLAPQNTAAVEDSANGVRAASAAGCTTLMVPDVIPVTDELRGLAAAILPSLAALPEYLQKNTG